MVDDFASVLSRTMGEGLYGGKTFLVSLSSTKWSTTIVGSVV